MLADGEVVLGPHQGYQFDAYSGAIFPSSGSVSDWKSTAWLIARNDLEAARAAVELSLPEKAIDAEALPAVHRWLCAQPLVCVRGNDVVALRKAGLRIYEVSFVRTADDFFSVRAEGGDLPTKHLSGPLNAFVPNTADPDVDDGEDPLGYADPTLIDRMLHAVSDGVLSERAVVNAFDARSMIRPGYGHYGEADGKPLGRTTLTHELRGVECLLAQLYERAETQRDSAQAIASALASVGQEEDHVTLPGYGRVTRERVAPVTLAFDVDKTEDLDPSYEVDGKLRSELPLASRDRWRLESDSFEPWEPTLPAEIEASLREDARRRLGGGSGRAVFVALLLLVFVAAIGWFLRR